MIRSILLLMLSIMVLAPTWVRVHGAPFACNRDLYLARAGTNITLFRFVQSMLGTGDGAAVVWGGTSTPGVNAIGLHQQDGSICGFNEWACE